MQGYILANMALASAAFYVSDLIFRLCCCCHRCLLQACQTKQLRD
jgi:hypothetical protein